LQNKTWFKANIKTLIESALIPVSFAVPITLLYFLEPNSFQYSWKGRTPYVIFLWLFILEYVIAGKKVQSHLMDFSKWSTRARVVAMVVALTAPTLYVIASFFWGLNAQIIELAKLAGAPYQTEGWTLLSWVLSLEYIVFTVCLIVSILLLYGARGFKQFPIALFFLGASGTFYMIDTYYPYGTLVALQALVPMTGVVVTAVLNLIGYRARLFASIERVILLVTPGTSNSPRYVVAIYWPSSGIHSLFIYTFTILLFLRGIHSSKKRKLLYFAVGAIGTFFVNVLRIVTIVILGLTVGASAAEYFHNYYGEFYFITWIIVYPLTIVYGRRALTALFNIMRTVAIKIPKPKTHFPARH